MSSNTSAQPWTELLPQIKSFVDSNNYKKLSSIVPKVLTDNNDLSETVRSTFTLIYIRSLLKTGSFQTAYDICTNTENKGAYVPEEAYALYRLKRYEECLVICQKASTSSSIENVGLRYTHAQCLYRLHKTNKALDIYSNLFQTQSFDGVEEEKEEIATNALACLQSTHDQWMPQSSTHHKWIFSDIPTLLDSNTSNYDLANNFGAFLSLSSTSTSSVQKGEQVLRMAIQECETQLEEDGLSKDDILVELLPIQANLAYALLMTGKMDEADEILNHVLASTPSPTTTSHSKHLPPSLQSARTSATNNIAVRRISTESLFDSLKRLTSSSGSGIASSEERQQMISTPFMMRSLLLNKAILLSKMKNKQEECLAILKQLSSGTVTSPPHYSTTKNDSKSKKNKKRSQSSKNGHPSMQEDNYRGFKLYAEIMEVEVLRAKGDTGKAQDKLQSMMNQYEGLLQTEIQLYQAQLNILEDGQGLKSAVTLLEKLQSTNSGVQSKPAIIATLISIYQDMNKSKEASDLLSNLSINSIASSSSEQHATIMSKKALGEYYLKMDMYQESIKVFQEILDMEEGNDDYKDECLALLVIATSFLDGEEAEEKLSYIAGLEDDDLLDDETEDVTGEALENMDIPWGTGGSSRRFLHQARGTDRGSKKKKKSKEAIQRYREKKREAYLARLTEEGKYNPDKPTKPDPERWIPKNQRSSNRRRRNRRYGAGTSHQGVGSGMEDKRLDARARAAGEISVGNGAPSTAHMSVSSGGGTFKKNRKGKKR